MRLDLEPADRGLQVRITPGVWLIRTMGDARLVRDGVGGEIDLENQVDLRDLEPAFRAELELFKDDKFLLHLSGFSFSTDARGTIAESAAFGHVQLAPGDEFRASLDVISVSGELRLPLYRPFRDSDGVLNTDGRRRIQFDLGPVVGARYIDLDQTLERIGGNRERTGGEWFAVHAGGYFQFMFRPEGDLPWLDRIGVETSVGIGPLIGGSGGFMWQVQSTVRAHITEHLALHLGYRLLDMNAKNGDYRFDGGLRGLFVGGTLSF